MSKRCMHSSCRNASLCIYDLGISSSFKTSCPLVSGCSAKAETLSSHMQQHRGPHAAASTAASGPLTHLHSGQMLRRRFGLRLPILLLPVCTFTECCQLGDVRKAH